MALPASQYSVLDGSKVERLDEETFRVYVAAFKFFRFEVQPVLTLQVHAEDAGCTISMLGCQLRGSRLIEAQNDQFAARMTNHGAHTCCSACPALQVRGIDWQEQRVQGPHACSACRMHACVAPMRHLVELLWL